MAASYDFVQLDVFNRTPLAGKPLAVFTDTRGLTDKQMQALACRLGSRYFDLPARVVLSRVKSPPLAPRADQFETQGSQRRSPRDRDAHL